MKYIKLFEDKNQELISLTQRGSTVVPKESIKKELYDSCDAKISKLQEQLKKVNSIKSDLDSDFSDLDFFVRANFSELPGFSHYFYGKPYYPDTNVSYNLVTISLSIPIPKLTNFARTGRSIVSVIGFNAFSKCGLLAAI